MPLVSCILLRNEGTNRPAMVSVVDESVKNVTDAL